jgi:hypothetical membrane protein
MMSTTAPEPATAQPVTPAATRPLLACGVIAGPLYVGVSLAQAFAREGFDPTRHEWSLLANGPFGWIQSANLMLSGVLMIAFAVGLRRALRPGLGVRWAPLLIGAYGLGLVCAGMFRADPRLGFPVGTPEAPGPVSWHGMLHLATAGIGFVSLIAGCLVMGARFARESRRGWAWFSRVTAIVFLAGFAAVASGRGGVVVNLGFSLAVIGAWVWLSAVAADRYRDLAGGRARQAES